MQIIEIQVNNFKSLVDFHLPLTKFNCLVGLNGSGKSTVLQFFDFLAQQTTGQLYSWLKSRNWNTADINSKLSKEQNIKFTVLLSTNNGTKINWDASFNLRQLRCTTETIKAEGKTLLQVRNTFCKFSNSQNKESIYDPIPFDYEGSILSQLKDDLLDNTLCQLKSFFTNLYALDLLSPELLRKRARDTDDSIGLGLGGERLSAFLYRLKEQEKEQILKALTHIYPSFKTFNVTSMRSGWKDLTFQELFNGGTIETNARHVADGYLRMLAIVAQLSQPQAFLLLDEIENGINLELIEFLMDTLVKATHQVLVTTHSPLVLNYLEDEVAQKGVIYLYRNSRGATQAIRLFDIPSMQEKLTVMGPGEVYEDTLLTHLHHEISLISNTH